MEKEKVYETYDLNLAAALLVYNGELIEMDKTNIKKVKFVFKRTEKLIALVDDYWIGRMSIKARKFSDTQRMLKNKIYSSSD